jgi:hypothetical protein
MTRRLKIVPAATSADTECLGLDQGADPALAPWLAFLKRWGGGHIWPNAHRAPAEIAALYGDQPAFNLQYLLTPTEVLAEHGQGTRSGWWGRGTLPIGRVSTGDVLLIVTEGEQAGQILYWAPVADGLNYLRLPVAASFMALLSGLYDEPALGRTPPWRHLSQSVFAATQDLVF